MELTGRQRQAASFTTGTDPYVSTNPLVKKIYPQRISHLSAFGYTRRRIENHLKCSGKGSRTDGTQPHQYTQSSELFSYPGPSLAPASSCPSLPRTLPSSTMSYGHATASRATHRGTPLEPEVHFIICQKPAASILISFQQVTQCHNGALSLSSLVAPSPWPPAARAIPGSNEHVYVICVILYYCRLPCWGGWGVRTSGRSLSQIHDHSKDLRHLHCQLALALIHTGRTKFYLIH